MKGDNLKQYVRLLQTRSRRICVCVGFDLDCSFPEARIIMNRCSNTAAQDVSARDGLLVALLSAYK